MFIVPAVQDALIRLRLMRGNKRPFNILDGVSGVLKPVQNASLLCRLPPRTFAR